MYCSFTYLHKNFYDFFYIHKKTKIHFHNVSYLYEYIYLQLDSDSEIITSYSVQTEEFLLGYFNKNV